MKITSLQNPKVKYWVSLKNKKDRDELQRFLVEGSHLVEAALATGYVEEIISTVDEKADYFVTEEIMKKISNQISISPIAAVVKFPKFQDIKGNILVLDGIQDPGNLGTMLRSCVAFDFSTIILSPTCVDLYNPKVIRATEGMFFNLSVLREDLVSFLPSLKDKGYTLVGTDVLKGEDIKKIPKTKVAIIIGSEGKGLSKEVRALCDSFVYLKMNANCESLNAGVAASILMYEVNHD